jgi:hypothetical protein
LVAVSYQPSAVSGIQRLIADDSRLIARGWRVTMTDKEINEIGPDIDRELDDIKLEDEQERVLTLKISLEGPSEVVSWFKENRPRLRMPLRNPLPREFRKHMRAAQREQLLAVRSLLDNVIDRMETDEQPVKRTRRIDVE